MIKNHSIDLIMSKKLITLHPKDKLQRAKDIFQEYDIHHIPVVVMNKIVGILSQGDILYLENVANNSFDKFIIDKKFELNTIDAVMTKDPICADINSRIMDVLDIILYRRINAVPIVDNDELVGLVTSIDLLSLMKDHVE